MTVTAQVREPNEINGFGRQPELVDSHVGARIRVCRKLQGHSQQQLAAALGLTFQQVQKYERGTNRVSASKLYEIARFLSVPIAYFFEELPETAGDTTAALDASNLDRRIHDFLRSPDGLELVDALTMISQPLFRRSLIQLVRTVAQQEACSSGSERPDQ